MVLFMYTLYSIDILKEATEKTKKMQMAGWGASP
jgi:hypothetical protein